jgi:PAS domain S-box-containing protein
MQTFMNTLVEGIVIIDEDEHIVMSNQSFARTAFVQEDRLIGRTLSSLPWLDAKRDVLPQDYPWKAAQRSNLPERSVPMRLQVGIRHERHLNVNASPILDPKGNRRGMLVTFDDQTIIESHYRELARLVGRFSQDEGGLRKLYEQLAASDDVQFAKFEELVRTARELASDCQSAMSSDRMAPDGSRPSKLEQPSQVIPERSQGDLLLTQSSKAES